MRPQRKSDLAQPERGQEVDVGPRREQETGRAALLKPMAAARFADQLPRRHSPERPPAFSSSVTEAISAPRSIPLTMS